MEQLNVLYTADNNYAPFLGVSLFSLLENNKDIENITVYAVLDNVSLENKRRIIKMAQCYTRELIVVDGADFAQILKTLDVPQYRNSYATYYRLFFSSVIDESVNKLLYIDDDSIIVDSLKPLLNLDFNGSIAMGVLDVLARTYKSSVSDTYLNAGVMYIDVNEWKRNNCDKKILKLIKNGNTSVVGADQDLLNSILRGKINLLPPAYNFTPFHYAFSDDVFYRVYGAKNYYTKDQIESARKNPVILHTYRFLGEFPWHKNNLHPCTPIFDTYLQRSPWNDYVKEESKNNSLVFKIERFLFRFLPQYIYLLLFKFSQLIWFINQEREYKLNKTRPIFQKNHKKR